MTQLKELYKGKCLDDLEELYQLPELRNNKLSALLSTAQKLYAAAEESLRGRDEELSYIFYMKYFNLIDYIRKTPEYKKNKDYVTKMLGGKSRQTLAMDVAYNLSSSLKKRYQLLADAEDLPNYSNSSLPNTTVSSIEEKTHSVIICEELFKMTLDPSASLLVMDCRPKADFQNSHMIFSCCLSVPEEIILPGMSAGMIQQELMSTSWSLWSSRSVKDHIILMDWDCKGPDPILHTPIWRLRDILQNWDPDVTYRSPLKILQGGYGQFILMYPNHCTNPNVQPPQKNTSEVEILDDIEYPSLHDITMKDDINYGSAKISTDKKPKFRPDIDRSSKAAAIQTYHQNKIEILQEREQLVEKALVNEKKLLEAESVWKAIKTQKESMENSDENMKLLTREQELLYNIMQLESIERDYKLENDRLKEQLEEYRRREKELGGVVSDNEAANVEQAEKRIEDKVRESKRFDVKLEIISQERRKQLAYAREQKRHLKPPTEEDEISKPKIPQFDRSVKPSFKAIPEPSERRDFSPIPGSPGRGLTGLKNLGNTCYMNSIMQCLSNTTSLAEYCITNTYRKHINKNNKTKGKIVEEVAALIKVLWSGHYKCVASKDLRFIIGQYQQIFRGIEQQDSHEFLTILMDWLHSDLQTLQISESPRDNLSASEKAWLEFSKYRESNILRLFYGQIKSTVKCRECSKESATYECFSNLSLELPPTANRCELNDSLTMYFSGENIRGWNCPNCKQKRDAVKKLDISKLPPILVVHFKRFYADPDTIGNTYKKKQSYVNFPLDNLDMTPFIAKSESRTITPKTYHLYGVSNHYGSMESGHYTAFCKSSVVGKWFKFDDQVVSSMDSSDVVSSAAYIIFYTYLPETPPPEIL